MSSIDGKSLSLDKSVEVGDLDPNIVSVEIDGKKLSFDKNLTIIQACEQIGITIPRFCYHEKLRIAGNCRMCLVEVKPGPPKPVASCTMQLFNGMQVFTDSEMVKKARSGVLELMLKNHPLDCPICDQGGECDLQDQAMLYGQDRSRLNRADCKRSVRGKNISPMIKTEMNRCIHCMRCVRFLEDIAGNNSLGAVGRGEDMEIATFLDRNIDSEISGNIIDLCPVGALTAQPSAFKYRSWSANKVRTIDLMDGVGANIVCYVENNQIVRIISYVNRWINQEWISDKARFSYDGLSNQRIDRYYSRNCGKLAECTEDVAIDLVKAKINQLGPKEMVFCIGPLVDMETSFAICKLANNLGINKICCLKENININSASHGNYLFNTTFANIEQATSCLIIGCNPRFEAPNVNIRLRELFLGGVAMSSIGCKDGFNYDINFLGSELKLLLDILNENHDYCRILLESERPMIIVSEDLFNNDCGNILHDIILQICYKYKVIRDDWNGFNFISVDANFCGNLFLTRQNNISICNETDVVRDLTNKKLKLVVSFGFSGTKIVDFMQHNNCDDLMMCYVGSNSDSLTNFADVVIPSLSYAEKSGLYMNIEGRVQQARQVVLPIEGVHSELSFVKKLSKLSNDDFILQTDSFINCISDAQFTYKAEMSKENCLFNVANNKNVPNIKLGDRFCGYDYSFLLSNSVCRNSVNMANYRKSLMK